MKILVVEDDKDLMEIITKKPAIMITTVFCLI